MTLKTNVLRRMMSGLRDSSSLVAVGLAITVIATLSGCGAAPDYQASVAVARFPPRSLGFEDGVGIYPSENSYVVYIDHDGFRPSASQKISTKTFSVTVSTGSSKSRYERAPTQGESLGSIEANDGATIFFRSIPHLEVMGASRMIGADAEITYLFHKSRLPELRRVDDHVVSALRKAETSKN